MALNTPSFYRPLNSGNNEIRLLEILSQDPVTCKLHTISLDSEPPFVALSYVWGDPAGTQEISINGIPTRVTHNLASALKHVKKHWSTTQNGLDSESRPSGFRLWADAICINQNDSAEKTAQVEMMGRIFTTADKVFAWLSSDDQEIASAFDMLESVFAAIKSTSESDGSDFPDLDGPCWADDINPVRKALDWGQFLDLWLYSSDRTLTGPEADFAGDDPWISIVRLGNLSFWSRIWIQQEVVLARRLHYISPSRHLSHGKFILAVQCLSFSLDNHKEKFLPDVGEFKIHSVAFALSRLATVLFLRQLAHKSASNFRTAQYIWAMKLTFSTDLEATRPLDYVYGLLGLSGLDIIPDYSKTTREVYIEFTQKHIEEWHRLGLAAGAPWQDSAGAHRECLRFLRTCAAGIQRGQGLPTWAPAMSSEKEMRAMCPGHKADNIIYSSVAALYDCPDIRVVGERLFVSAVRAQAVRSCYREPFSQDFLIKGLGSCLERFLEEYGPKYINGEPLLAVLCCTFLTLEGCRYDMRKLHDFLSNHGQLTDGLLERMEADGLTASWGSDRSDSVLTEWRLAVERNAESRLISTEDGYIGLAGADVQEGDVVCILASCNSPVLLRPEGDHYLFVGGCFVLGLLHGEVADLVDSGRATVEVIEIE